MKLNIDLLPELIKEMRAKRGMTQWQLSQKTGIAYSYIAKMEIGKVSPGIKNLVRIFDVLGIEISISEIE